MKLRCDCFGVSIKSLCRREHRPSVSVIIEYIFQQQQLLLLHHLDDVLVSHHMGYADALWRVLGGGAPNQSVLELRCQCAMDGVANVFHTDAL